VLETLDLDKELSKATYRKTFPILQDRLRQLQYDLQQAEIATVLVFEGVDAAGKGTTIARLVEKLDPRLFRVFPAMPPTKEEKNRHFLWRWQMRLPDDGRMAIFDRSWYGRVLVERREGLASEEEVRRAFGEIRDFERWLAEDGQVIVKFWLHIAKKTQKKRFLEMEADPLTRWKVTKEDWRHHKEYDEWLEDAERTFEATDTPHAPWTLIPAKDGRFARVEVFQTLIRHMEDALARRLRKPEEVSRTALAEEHTRKARERRAGEDSKKARSEAKAAGLPLEEAGAALKVPKGRRRGAGKGKAKGKGAKAHA